MSPFLTDGKCSKILNTFLFLFLKKFVCYKGWNSQNACQNSKQGRAWSDCFFRSSLIWVCPFFPACNTGSIKFWSLPQGVRIWNFEEKNNQKKQTRKIFRLCFWLNDDALNSSVVWELTSEGERLFYCGIVPRKKRVLQGITVCLVSTILGTVWWPGQFQTVSRGQVLVFFYRHSTRMYLMKEKLGGPVPMGLKICPVCLCLFDRQLGFKILDLYHIYT